VKTLPNKLVIGIALGLAFLWTLGMGLAYGLLGFTGEFTHWLNDLLNISPDVATWLASTGGGIERWGGGLLIAVWALGVIVLALGAVFARRAVYWFNVIRHHRGFA
jgi:hypothetical protein